MPLRIARVARWIEKHEPNRMSGLDAIERAALVLGAAVRRSRRGISRQTGTSEAELVA